jgi:hypothetical protein
MVKENKEIVNNENTNLVILKDMGLVKSEDMKFLTKHSADFQDRHARRSLFRSKFEMEASVLNDMVHPTTDSKYWQAIGEQSVHVSELIRLGFSAKKTEAEVDLLNAQIEELEDRKVQAQAENKPEYVTKKLNAHIKKKKVELQEKSHSMIECEKVAKERIKEIKNWEQIIPPLEENLKHGKEDWEAHHAERSLMRTEISMRNFDLLDIESKKGAVRDFTAAVQHPDNVQLVQERRNLLKQAGAGQQTYDQAGAPPLVEEKGSAGAQIESTEATMPTVTHPVASPEEIREAIKGSTVTTNMPTIGAVNTGLGAFAGAAGKVVEAKDKELSKPSGMSLKGNVQTLQQPEVSTLKDFKSRADLVKNKPIAKQYFDRAVRRILCGAPHRFQTDSNVTNFQMLQMPAAVDSHLESPWGFNVPDSRNVIVDKAFEMKADYIFFVDDDTIVPRNALVQLFHHLNNNPEALMAGGTYYRKYQPLESVPMLEAPDTTPYAQDAFAPIGEVIHNCLVLPSGCTLIDMELFRRLEKPYYEAFTVEGRAATTEDTIICQKARNVGSDIILDTGIQCLHIDKSNGTIYGHSEIVDLRSNTVNVKYKDYFAATFTE